MALEELPDAGRDEALAEVERLRAALQSIVDHEIACRDCAGDHDEDSCDMMHCMALAAIEKPEAPQ